MNKLITPLFLTVALTFSPISYAGVPVIDVSAIAKALQQIDKLNQQLQTQRDMLENMRNEYDELHKATSGFADFMPDALEQLHTFLPENPLDIESLKTTGGGIDAIKDTISDVKESLEAYTVEDIFKDTTTKVSNEYKQEGDFIYSQIAVNKIAYKKTQDRKALLEAYRVNLQGADTPKKTMDLLTRINIENAFLLNEIIAMQALKNQTDLQQLSIERNAEARGRVITTTAEDLKLH